MLAPKIRQGNTDKLRLYSDYSGYKHRYIPVINIINRHWYLLFNILRCHSTLLFTYRKQKSLMGIMVQNRLGPKQKFSSTDKIWGCIEAKPIGKYLCGNFSVCCLCFYTNFLNNSSKWRECSIKSLIKCTSEYMIYVIQCPCDLIHACFTTRAVMKWICEKATLDYRGENALLVQLLSFRKDPSSYYTNFATF